MKFSILSLLALFLASAPAMAEEEVDQESQIVRSVDCSQRKESRQIRAITHFAGCRLQYTKAGKMSQVASSRRGVDICLQNLEKIQKNLEAAGYECK